MAYASFLPVAPEVLFEFHMDVRNLTAISPPFPRVQVAAPCGRTAPGDLQEMTIGRGPLSVRWVARIERVVEGRLLEDVQERGPFRRWRHRHSVAAAEGGSVLRDAVSFRLIPTAVGEFVEFWSVRPMLWTMFWWRHRRTRALVAHHK